MMGSAVVAMLGGMQSTYQQLMDVLGREGLEVVPAAGEPFDPTVHEAVLGGGDGLPGPTDAWVTLGGIARAVKRAKGSEAAVYIGDHRRDIEAGRRAGMFTVAAAYGYIEPDDDPDDWGASVRVDDSRDLIDLLLES